MNKNSAILFSDDGTTKISYSKFFKEKPDGVFYQIIDDDNKDEKFTMIWLDENKNQLSCDYKDLHFCVDYNETIKNKIDSVFICCNNESYKLTNDKKQCIIDYRSVNKKQKTIMPKDQNPKDCDIIANLLIQMLIIGGLLQNNISITNLEKWLIDMIKTMKKEYGYCFEKRN